LYGVAGTSITYTYGYDVHGSVSQLLAPDGSTKASYGYTPYGQSDGQLSQGDTDTTKVINPFRYSAKRVDTASGTVDMGVRRFGPDVAHFLTPDFFYGSLSDLSLSTDPLSDNRYDLAGGNPISFREWDGHMALADGYGGAAIDPTPAPVQRSCDCWWRDVPGGSAAPDPTPTPQQRSCDCWWRDPQPNRVKRQDTEPPPNDTRCAPSTAVGATRVNEVLCHPGSKEAQAEQFWWTQFEHAFAYFALAFGGPKAGPAERSGLPAAGRLTVETGATPSSSELAAARYMANQGHNVVYRQQTGATKISDLLVDGVPYDVYTPITSNPDNVILGIAEKGPQVQGGGVVLDLSQTSVTAADLGNVMARVSGLTPDVTNVVILPK
jgi:RHS repeat-associated protein